MSGPKKQKLEGSYREWLERDVAYNHHQGERDTFIRLATDEARDRLLSSLQPEWLELKVTRN